MFKEKIIIEMKEVFKEDVYKRQTENLTPGLW